VVLNPLRAGMVQDPGQWPWSSYGAMLAPAVMPGADWLATDKLLAYFAPDQQSLDRVPDRKRAQQRYVNHVREGIGLPSVWADLSGQVYLGDEKFVNKISAMAEQTPQGAHAGRSRLEIPHAQRRPVPLPLQGYVEQYPNNRGLCHR
jgi:putative transposase